jgi:hypothetical protein
MKNQRSIAVLASSVALFAFTAFGTAAQANEIEDQASFSGMFKLDYIDGMKDGKKDGMVSKDEYLMMMAKVWDMKAKEMKMKGDKMSAEEFKQLTKWLSRGEKN